MRIKTRLLVSIAVSAVASLAVGWLLLANAASLESSARYGHVSQSVAVGVLRLNVLTHDYVVHGDEAARREWFAQDAEVERLLDSMKPRSPKEASLLSHMRSTQGELRPLFERMVGVQPGFGQRPAAAAERAERELSSALSAHTEDLGSDSLLLHTLISRALLADQRQAALLGFVFVLLALGLSMSVSLYTTASVGQGLTELERAAQSIADGDLDARVRVVDGSEIGQLGVAFNEMATRLAHTYESLATEVNERRRAEETITHMAYFDPLTGLANRSLFNDRLALAIAHAQRHSEGLAVMFVDIDHFKAVNDTLGHSFGDALLKQIADRLRSVVRADDTIARYGGDEFTLLLSHVETSTDVEGVAAKLLEVMEHPYSVREHEIHVTASLGVALWPEAGDTGEALLKNADAAMYEAKETGPNRYRLYHPSMSEQAELRFSLKNDLRRALEENELFIEYQPQVTMDAAHIVGGEALVRWDHPTRGRLAPKAFIALAEESGLIVPLGEWVLHHACLQAREWRRTIAPDFRVAVNLSAIQFVKGNLLETVERVLVAACLPADALELEITETIAMQNTPQLLDMLDGLRELGVRVALDDFGIGYSSLGYLQRLPIHTLKIAGPFVEGVCTSTESAAIATTIIDLAKGLDLDIVAEGVETQEQLDFLCGSGCTVWQGFLFSQPLPPEEFTALLERRSLKVV